MAYQALYRKFRPPVFDDVRGQDHIVTTLRNQVMSGRTAHAYLFCGTRGTGKTSVAKIMARAVNCENLQGGNPCGECETCRAILSGANLNVVEIDAASNNGVDNIREIVDEVAYSPTMGRFKVYIIDEVHMLSTGAFNALLKTLEEPPEYVIFILATTEVQKIPVTIQSRCQRYDFHRLSTATIEDRLKEVAEKEGIAMEEKALQYIARSADGAMRDALSLLDRCLAFCNDDKLTYEKVLDVLGTVDTDEFIAFFKELSDADTTAALQRISKAVSLGSELTQYVNDFVWFLRNLMLLLSSDAAEDSIDVYADSYEQMKALCATTDLETLLFFIRTFSELTTQIRFSAQKRILLEMTVIRICKPQMQKTSDVGEAFAARLSALEKSEARTEALLKKIKSGAVTVTEAKETVQPVKRRTKALPEEVEAVREKWGAFVNALSQPVRSYLSDARPSVSDDNVLIIVADTKMNADLLQQETVKAQVTEKLEELTGKEVPFEVSFVPEDGTFETSFYDLEQIPGVDFPITPETE